MKVRRGQGTVVDLKEGDRRQEGGSRKRGARMGLQGWEVGMLHQSKGCMWRASISLAPFIVS